MNPLLQLQELGQSVWYDHIRREMLLSGELRRMIEEEGLHGITSNPTIFEKAINGSSDYDDALSQLLRQNPALSSSELFYALAIEDIQHAADLLLPVYTSSGARDGMVSLEVSPDLAYDGGETIRQARSLAKRVNRPNLMIKVPATHEGLEAIEVLTSEGINVNATLLFSVQRYMEVVESYLLGLESRLRRGQSLQGIASVASFFISRVDTKIDGLLDEKMPTVQQEQAGTIHALHGKTAIVNAKIAYRMHQDLFSTKRFAALQEAGGQPQRLLWASTGTKNRDYSDTVYVDALIGPETVNTLPPATYNAYLDHGTPRMTLEEGMDEAYQHMKKLNEADIDLDSVSRTLEAEGVQLFSDSYHALLAAIEEKSARLRAHKNSGIAISP